MNTLILVDIQNDFLPGGSLAVPNGDGVIRVANSLIASGRFQLIVATQDWHPAEHGSFASRHPGKQPFSRAELDGLPQTLWPDHCVQWSGGAMLAPGLETRSIHRVFPKGTDPKVDSYSGFYDNGRRASTGMGEYLLKRGVKDVTVIGLATDYCVKFTVLDACELGFRARVLLPGCRGVNIAPGDSDAAAQAMKLAGAEVLSNLPA